MAKRFNAHDLESYKSKQKIVDELQTKELARQQAKDKEHSEAISKLEKESKESKKDIEQLKNELNSAIEASTKVIDNSEKDSKQDVEIARVNSNLLSEALRIKELYKSFENETSKIAELYDEIYALKQKNVSKDYRDNIQDIDTKAIEDKLDANKQTDAEQSANISRNKLNISSNFKYIESIDKRLKDNNKGDKITRFISVLSLIGVIALAIAIFSL